MNRRPDRDGDVPNAPNPGGPVDDRLFVLSLRDAAGELAAVGLRVSCHPVATGSQHLLTADYPGAWRSEFERAFGVGVIPFFLQGSGADARPRHVANGDTWRTMKHAELADIGRDLLTEALRVLTGTKQRQLQSLVLAGRLARVPIPCEARHTSRADFAALQAAGKHVDYAKKCLARLAEGKPIPDHQEFWVQTLWLDDETALIGIDAEVLCGLGAVVESAVAPKQGIMLGYTNGVLCYVPDAKELARGGYETLSYLYRPWAGPFQPGIEDRFAAAVLQAPPPSP